MRRTIMASLMTMTLLGVTAKVSPAQTQAERSTRLLISAVAGMESYLEVNPPPEGPNVYRWLHLRLVRLERVVGLEPGARVQADARPRVLPRLWRRYGAVEAVAPH